MPDIEEPSYLAFARADVRNGYATSSGVVRALLERIDRDAAALKAAKPLQIRAGRYRNKVGAVIHVTRQRTDSGLLGEAWDAEQHDGVFGTIHLFVTPQGLQEAGYERND